MGGHTLLSQPRTTVLNKIVVKLFGDGAFAVGEDRFRSTSGKRPVDSGMRFQLGSFYVSNVTQAHISRCNAAWKIEVKARVEEGSPFTWTNHGGFKR